jgi:hypothetical protein
MVLAYQQILSLRELPQIRIPLSQTVIELYSFYASFPDFPDNFTAVEKTKGLKAIANSKNS